MPTLRTIISGLALLLFTGLAAAAQETSPPDVCSPTDAVLDYWRGVRSNVAAVDGNRLALPLAHCLDSPNAELRDRIGYEVLTYWLRKGELTPETRKALRQSLQPWLARGDGAPGSDAIARAFAALILSELVRADRLDPRWTPEELADLVNAAAEMVRQERDYRGLDAEIGWIHTVAHGSDLLWQLAQHPGTSADQHRAMLMALASQFQREDTPPFVFNESDRTARVVVAVIQRGELATGEVTAWIGAMGDPGSLEQWNRAFGSISGMARLHNTKQFLRALQEALPPEAPDGVRQKIEDALVSLP